jgi:hypothetical protein
MDTPHRQIAANGDQKGIAPLNGTDYTLAEVQKHVGGLVEVLYNVGGDPATIMLVDEEGLLKGLPFNALASALAKRYIVGTVIVIPLMSFK